MVDAGHKVSLILHWLAVRIDVFQVLFWTAENFGLWSNAAVPNADLK